MKLRSFANNTTTYFTTLSDHTFICTYKLYFLGRTHSLFFKSFAGCQNDSNGPPVLYAWSTCFNAEYNGTLFREFCVGAYSDICWASLDLGGRDSAVGIATRYGLDSLSFEPRWGRDRPLCPPSLLYNGYQMSFRG